MDSVTHLALGVCTGEIILGKKLGKRALLWGAFAQSLPDIDNLATGFYPADEGYLVHRGITHSLLFAIIMGVLLAFVALKIHDKAKLSLLLLVLFFVFELALHDLLDTCNAYGTGLFEPFSHHRFSINLLYVADPLFTLGLVIAALLLIFKSTMNPHRARWAFIALTVSVVYLGFAASCKAIINTRVVNSLQHQGITPPDFFTTPAPLNSMLWYVVARKSEGFYTGYRSVWDHQPDAEAFEWHPQNNILLTNQNVHLCNTLITFAQHDYVLTRQGGITYLNVLRFEQAQGWALSNAPFMFSYPLSGNGDQGLLLQKGRMRGWSKPAVKRYFARIAGNKPYLK